MSKSFITAKEIIEILRAKYQKPWVFFDELRLGTAFSKKAKKRIDAFVLNTYPSSKFHKIGFEIKISKLDFLSELKNPDKRKTYMEYCNQFFFVGPKSAIDINLIPLECGYIEITNNKELKVMKEAPFKETKLPSWLFVSSLARRIAKNEGVDFSLFTNDSIDIIYNYFKDNKILNGTEKTFFYYIEKEKIKRDNAIKRRKIAARKLAKKKPK